jgi:hypothetical protein
MFQPKYRRVDTRVVRAVRALFASKPYRKPHGEQVSLLNVLAAATAQAYRIPTPRVTIEPHASAGALGSYDPDCNTIFVPRFSVTATLVQLAKVRGFNDAKAKAWAASALFLAVPKTFEKMVRARNIKFVKVRELA